MEESGGESRSPVPGGGAKHRFTEPGSTGGRVAEPGLLPQPAAPSPVTPAASRDPDETTIRDASNEQMANTDTAQWYSFPGADHNSCGYEVEPREQTTASVSLESDFFVSLKLAAILTFIFVAVTILLVCSKQNEPLLLHPDSPKFSHQHSLNQKLHKLRLLFPRQSDSFWAALENIFNQLPTDPAEIPKAQLVGVGYGVSWNTMLCLSKTIASLLLVSASDLGPDGKSKVRDYSQVLWSQAGSSPSPGTSHIIIAEIVKNLSCTVTLSLQPVTEPTAVPTSFVSVWSINAEPKQETFPSNFTLRIMAKVLHHLNQTVPINTDIPNTSVVTVNPEDHLESGFLC
ncbi:uncharacterized protein LOC127582093 [Pristis pectinata]|uniref:uncharacterized protein LOC127582093 n=1 Tax=Pristis pectinata TaxID=685728 RepID=UPI00223E86AC|nr:uncharacterized protein LOC127582093 [Pristis pectinata]